MKTLTITQTLTLTLTLTLAVAQACAAPALRDPFVRPAATLAAAGAAVTGGASNPDAPPAHPQPQLRAVMYEPGKSLANIDGRIVASGDHFDDYTVGPIGERAVTLTRRGARLVLVLDQESSK